MSKLSDAIRARIKEMGATQKEVAAAIHADFEKGPSARPDRFETLEPKLSKLLSGDAEGERYFFDARERLDALADATGIGADDLLRLREAVDLVLDPLLPGNVRTYLFDRQRLPAASFACVSVELPNGLQLPCVEFSGNGAPTMRVQIQQDAREMLRKAIKAAVRRPRSTIVVLATAGDSEYFAGADLRTTTIRKDPRGFVLEGHPDLVPLPDPPPPVLWADDATPLLPSEETERRILDSSRPYSEDHEAKRIRELREKGCVPTFELPLAFRGARNGADAAMAQLAIGAVEVLWQNSRRHPAYQVEGFVQGCFQVLIGASTQTYAWAHGRRIFAVGPAEELLSQRLAPHHTVSEAASIGQLRTAVSTLNPWRAAPPERADPAAGLSPRRSAGDRRPEPRPDLEPGRNWAALRQAIIRETGLDFSCVVEGWRKHIEPEPRESAESTRRPARFRLRPSAAADAEPVREAVRALLDREFDVDADDAGVLFVLRSIEKARVVLLESRAGGFHALADMGAGNLLRVRAMRFPGEEAMPVEVLGAHGATVLDGGDVRVWLASGYDQRLEGEHLVARANRREEAVRAAEDDD